MSSVAPISARHGRSLRPCLAPHRTPATSRHSETSPEAAAGGALDESPLGGPADRTEGQPVIGLERFRQPDGAGAALTRDVDEGAWISPGPRPTEGAVNCRVKVARRRCVSASRNRHLRRGHATPLTACRTKLYCKLRENLHAAPPAATRAIVFDASTSSARTESSRCSGFVSSSFACDRPRRLWTNSMTVGTPARATSAAS